jgi:hypothetical protein
MNPAPVCQPILLGELLEQLRLEGFAVTPDIYDRCILVVNRYFPEGLTKPFDAVAQLQQLRELLGPVIVRSDIEQEKFGQIFDRLMTEPMPSEEVSGVAILPDSQEIPSKTNFLIWGSFLVALLLAIGIVYHYYPQPKPVDPDPKPKPSDTNQSQTVNPNCVINVSIQSIQGNTVTFANRSPGLKNGYQYRWNFGETTSLVTTTDSLIVHQFQKLTSSSTVKITLSDGGCNQTVILRNIYSDTNPTLPSFPLIQAPPIRKTIYTLNPWYLLLAVLLGTGVVGLITFRYFFPRRKVSPSNDAPYFLSFPDQEKTIKVADSMDVWARQLNQRDEGQRRVMDISRTIRATARMGGYPSISYQQIKLRPRYLVLIDSRSTFHQQARLYAYLGNVLTAGEVELETLFFNADPRTCWSEKYPKGIAISNLYRLNRDAYLVLITEGIRLIDYDKGSVASWVTNLFDGWEKRAVLTPVYPENWTYIESILSQCFIVLPATPDGQLLLRAYFQAGELPTFQELRRRFRVNSGQVVDRGFFGKSADKLSITDIDQFLDNPFDDENPTEPEKNRLKQWAYATAVYPTPTWEMTLAIGSALEQYYQSDEIVTTTNLLKITALPWLQQSKIPDQLHQELLQQFEDFPAELKNQIHAEVLGLLESVKTTPGSMAEEERELHTYKVLLTDENRRQEGLRKLAPFQKAGLITDKVIEKQVAVYSRKISLAYVLNLVIVAVVLSVMGYLSVSKKATKPVAGLGRFLYSQTCSDVSDSAVIYNNVAASMSKQTLDDTALLSRIEKIGPAFGYKKVTPENSQEYQGYYRSGEYFPTTDRYKLRLSFLMASLRYRITFEALYNLHALRYGNGVFQDTVSGTSIPEMTRSLSPLREVPKIVAPLSILQFGNPAPQNTDLENYVKLLNKNISIDSTIKWINARDNYNTNVKQYSHLTASAQQEVSQARQAAQFNHVNLLLPNELKEFGKNVLRVRLPRLNLSGARLDSLAQLDAARIRVYLSRLPNSSVSPPPQPTTSLPPTSTVPTTNSATTTATNRTGIPGEYGVLIGELVESKTVNNTIYLQVRADYDYYRVAIGANNSSKGSPSQRSVFGVAQGDAVYKLPPYQKLRSKSPGFYELAKNKDSGALDYLRAGDSYKDFKVNAGISTDELIKLMTDSGKLPVRIYVWGARRRPSAADNVFGMGKAFQEMQYVRMNQGSFKPNDQQNAPWQDGGIIVEPNAKDPRSLKAVAIRFSSQSTSVDQNGNPTGKSGSTGGAW